MSIEFPRRTFTLAGPALLVGLSAGRPTALQAATGEPGNQRLVSLGLNALARAPGQNYFADGHRGAAMISAHLMCIDNHFEAAAVNRINELFDRNWAQSPLCQPFPQDDPIADAAERIGKALADGGSVLRQVGHNAIFAMHAIKGFSLLPEAATEERVAGVCRLIQSFKPWRDAPPDDAVQPPPFEEEVAASRFVLAEAIASIDRFKGFGQGFAGHLLTFGQSLIELAALGHVEWAESCRQAFRKYVTVTRLGPQATDRAIKPHPLTKLRPNNLEYWQRRGDKTLGLGHVFKYPYAAYDLLARANDPALEKAFDSCAWRLF